MCIVCGCGVGVFLWVGVCGEGNALLHVVVKISHACCASPCTHTYPHPLTYQHTPIYTYLCTPMYTPPNTHPTPNTHPQHTYTYHRDTHTFTRRKGRLPEQREGDALDYRPLLHRDGSVLSVVDFEVHNWGVVCVCFVFVCVCVCSASSVHVWP